MKQDNGFLIKSLKMNIVGNRFEMKLKSDMKLLESGHFRCCIYAEDFFLMCNDAGDNAAKVCGATITVAMQSQYLWLPGDYMLIFEVGGSFLGVMDFTVDDEQHVELCSIQPAGCFSQEDVALSYLSTDDSWQTLATMPGTGALRQAAVEVNRMNLWSMALNIDVKHYARQPSGYIFTSTHAQEKVPLAIRSFHKLLSQNKGIEIVDSSTLYDATLQNPVDKLNQLFDNTDIGTTICLDHVGALTGSGGRVVVNQFAEALRQRRFALWLCGTAQEIDALFNMFPSLRQHFPDEKRLSFLPPTFREMVHNFFHQLQAWDLHPTDEAAKQLKAAIRRGYDDGTLALWTADDINRFYQEKVMTAYLKRLAATAESFAKDELKPEDIDYTLLYGHTADEEVCLHELNQMVGLDNVKKSIATITHQLRIFAERRQQGLPTSGKEVFHSVFTGSPGTGKTTVAKMLGKIYHHLGVLSKGEVITVDRSRLVGRFIGDTEENVKNLLKEARGNVLFIDEAYTLYGPEGSNDFGRRAIECLLTSLSEKNPDMLVVFAGYQEEMDRLMTMNPGLYDRFPYKFHFADYTAEQLIQIAEHLFVQDEYQLTEEARKELQESVEMAVQNRSPHFGNARWVEQFVRNGIIPALADRLASTKAFRPLCREDYQRVEASDIKTAYEQFAPHPLELKPRLRVVGFGS